MLAQQGMVEIPVAQDPHQAVALLEQYRLAGLVANLDGLAHGDIGIGHHQGILAQGADILAFAPVVDL